jgi:hypothetical protein
MAILRRNNLKAEFQTGNMVTQEYFGDFIDSAFNKEDDSVLLGPLGLTGKYGLLGPTGGTTIGMYISNATGPTSSTSLGSTGQVIFGSTGTSGANMFIHNGTQWFKFEGLRNF